MLNLATLNKKCHQRDAISSFYIFYREASKKSLGLHNFVCVLITKICFFFKSQPAVKWSNQDQ